MRPPNDLILSGGELGHERGNMLETFRRVLKEWKHCEGAGDLTGLKDKGVEDASERVEDAGTATTYSPC